MKKRILITLSLVIVLVLGCMALVGCDDTTDGNGTKNMSDIFNENVEATTQNEIYDWGYKTETLSLNDLQQGTEYGLYNSLRFSFKNLEEDYTIQSIKFDIETNLVIEEMDKRVAFRVFKGVGQKLNGEYFVDNNATNQVVINLENQKASELGDFYITFMLGREIDGEFLYKDKYLDEKDELDNYKKVFSDDIYKDFGFKIKNLQVEFTKI